MEMDEVLCLLWFVVTPTWNLDLMFDLRQSVYYRVFKIRVLAGVHCSLNMENETVWVEYCNIWTHFHVVSTKLIIGCTIWFKTSFRYGVVTKDKDLNRFLTIGFVFNCNDWLHMYYACIIRVQKLCILELIRHLS